jgi:hypothetical protein
MKTIETSNGYEIQPPDSDGEVSFTVGAYSDDQDFYLTKQDLIDMLGLFEEAKQPLKVGSSETQLEILGL